jgi:flagellin
MFRINTNLASINARRQLFKTTGDTTRALERLSSGLRINRAADDAAGLTASEGMRSQIVGARQSNRNISQAITLLQTADSGYEQIGNMLLRLKELATQAADGSLNATNRSAIFEEATALYGEISRIANATTFNGISLIASNGGAQGGGGTDFTFYVGDGTGGSSGVANQKLSFSVGGVSIVGLTTIIIGSAGVFSVAISASAFLEGLDTAATAIANLESAISALSVVRSKLGAFQNRLERSQLNVQAMLENTSNAESIIRDADFAVETSALTRAQILVQAGSSVLQQANILPQNALLLLQA